MEFTTQLLNDSYNITLRGRFTFSDNPEFREMVLEKIKQKEIKSILLHMDLVEFLDSAALGMLLLAHDEAKQHNKEFLIQGVNSQIKRIFDMARFNQFFSY